MTDAPTRDEIIQKWINIIKKEVVGMARKKAAGEIQDTGIPLLNKIKDAVQIHDQLQSSRGVDAIMSTVPAPPAGAGTGLAAANTAVVAEVLNNIAIDNLGRGGLAEFYCKRMNEELKQYNRNLYLKKDVRALKRQSARWYAEEYRAAKDPAYRHGDSHKDTLWALKGEFLFDGHGNVVGYTVRDAEGNKLQDAVIEPHTGRYFIFDGKGDPICQEGSPWDTDKDYAIDHDSRNLPAGE